MKARQLLSLFMSLWLFIGIAGASSLFPLSPSTNTIYQNTNLTNALAIYVVTGGELRGWIGPSSTNLTLVSNSSIVLTGIVGATFAYNQTTTLIVPPGWWWKVSYTSSTFTGEYSSYGSEIASDPSLDIILLAVAFLIVFAFGREGGKTEPYLRDFGVLMFILLCMIAAYFIMVN